MKKILYSSTVLAAIFLHNISITYASEAEMPNNEFNSLVCGYLHSTDNKTEAMDRIKAMIESKINDSQLAKLDEITKSNRAARDFCKSSLPRL